MKKKIFLVYKTHFDIGFTDLAEKVIESYAGPMLADAITACEGTKELGKQRYVWTMAAWPLEMMKQNCKDKRPALEALIENGQIVWHALPFTSHFDFCGLEDTVQGLRYGRELCEQYRKPLPQTAKMTDVPGHGAMLPAVLAGAGVKFLHLGSNDYPWTPETPPLFFWEAPDGSRVLTMYCHSYGSSAQPPEDWPFPVWMALMHTHDNCGPQSADAIRALVADLQSSCPDTEVLSGGLDDFYVALSQCDLSGVPVLRGDLADSWIHGVGSYPREVAAVRQARRTLVNAKILNTLQKRPNRAEVAATAAEAYDNLALFGEHTWGLDVKTWLGSDRVYEKADFINAKKTPKYAYMERSWQEQAGRAQAAGELAKKALDGVTGEGGQAVLNPGTDPFTGWVSTEQGAVYLQNIPPLSAVNLSEVAPVEAAPLKVTKKGSLCAAENHRYRVDYNEATGEISCVYDKLLGAALLQARNGKSVFAYQYDKCGSEDIQTFLDDYRCDSYIPSVPDWGEQDNGRENYPECRHQTFAPAFSGVAVEDSTLTFSYSGAACREYGDAEKICLKVTLPAAGDELFVRLELKNKQETPFVEGGSLIMPLAMDAPSYAINKNGYVLNPKTDIVPCANHVFYCLEDFAAAQGRDAALCVVAADTPLLAIGEPGVYTYRKNYKEQPPIFYFNLFNNMWGTNFPQWTGGDLAFSFTLFGCKKAEDSYARASALAQGAIVACLPPVSCPAALPKGTRVMSMEPQADGFVVRFRDTTGKPRSETVAAPGMHLQQLDLQGRPIGDPATDKLLLDMPRWSIHTISIMGK